MTADGLLEIIEAPLQHLGARPLAGGLYRTPPLEIVRFYHRPVRMHWLPLLGRASGVVAVVREPPDLVFSAGGYRQLLRRLAMACNSHFPPWQRGGGLSIGMTVVVLAATPIGPQDDTLLAGALGRLARMRSVPLGLIRVNLEQEAMAFALASGPGNLFPEPVALADALTPHLRRFVPAIDSGA